MKKGLRLCAKLRSCVKREVGLGPHSLSHYSPVLNKPYGFCVRKAPRKKKKKKKKKKKREPHVLFKCNDWTDHFKPFKTLSRL